LSEQLDPGPVPPSPIQGIAGLIVANSSLLIAGLVYMGWAYTDALLGYFHLSPLDLGVGVVEYVLSSLGLFSPAIVIVAAALIAVTAVRAWDLDLRKLAAAAELAMPSILSRFSRPVSTGIGRLLQNSRVLLIAAGTAAIAAGLVLNWLAGHVYISTYLVLSLLGGGPLILTWPTRTHRHGRSPYALAIVVAAVCALWAGSLYAHDRGLSAAQSIGRGLPAATAVAVYSIQRLSLSGPGVSVQSLSAEFRYRYRYIGLRLLTTGSGTYYLLPVNWTPGRGSTYVLDDSDEIRIELYSAERNWSGAAISRV
jgi:hypothetical protein